MSRGAAAALLQSELEDIRTLIKTVKPPRDL